jgi:hypothetical protein
LPPPNAGNSRKESLPIQLTKCAPLPSCPAGEVIAWQ